jgi:membrane-bound metal-dependent hydrolase YbcI (DUF457 family)
MPQAVTHILIAIVLMSLIRDFYISKKGKKSFPLHYVLIAGIAWLLPDIDIIAFWGLNFLGFTLNEVHRTFTHTLFVPLLFFILFLAFSKVRVKELGKHKLKLNIIFLMIAFGAFIHLLLDATLAGYIRPFYPFSLFSFGINLIGYLPSTLRDLALPSLDAIILVVWLVYVELRHKISDFV